MSEGQAGFDAVLSIGGDEVLLMRNVTVNLRRDEIEDTTRGNVGWKSFICGLGEWGVSCEILHEKPNTLLQAIEDAFLGAYVLNNVRMVDKEGYGWQGNVVVTEFSRSEPLQDVISYTVTFKGRGAPIQITAGAS